MPGRVTPLVEAVQLEKCYVDGPSVVRVLEGLALTVERGERIAIVGESGIGKSTLLHLLGALDRPTSGRVLFDGDDVFARSDAELAVFRNRAVGFVFQFHHLLGDFTALENVMLPGLIARQPAPTVRARAIELLERVGLQHRLAHRPGQLSGGEQQRVAVARALCLRPALVLADEPTGNLDPATAEEVQELLLQLNAEHGATLVVATHNPKLAAAMSRTLRLAGGRLYEEPAWTPSTRRGGVGGGAV
jgi:lipoprotein-releasing system ATP-binding protein